jgi:hypothetical protein
MGHDEAADDEKDVDATAPKRRPLIALRGVVAGVVRDDHQSGHRPQVLDPVDPEWVLGVCPHDAGRQYCCVTAAAFRWSCGPRPAAGARTATASSTSPQQTLPSVV